jgi:hypothetical protein
MLYMCKGVYSLQPREGHELIQGFSLAWNTGDVMESRGVVQENTAGAGAPAPRAHKRQHMPVGARGNSAADVQAIIYTHYSPH